MDQKRIFSLRIEWGNKRENTVITRFIHRRLEWIPRKMRSSRINKISLIQFAYQKQLFMLIFMSKKIRKNHKFLVENGILSKKRVEILGPPASPDLKLISTERSDF